ncbi:hypothetical protein QBZ16_004495 [Prototheca wickerhamii]|uniref:U6 snRNA-associated Sm-like protein LSm1 n=1 Tax=Prototheca wickerhamii TaxID=3111 RepID=A0AAD9IIC4_PROWI|nr:hypothetical protein QBZ16_004495 [Prototheca wickerhamii]
MDPPLILPPNIDDVPPPGLALVLELDKPLLVQLRDGRKVVGTLRSFDQFANLVLEGAYERIIVGNQYAEIPMGLHVSEEEIKNIQRADKEAERMKGTFKSAFDFLMDE